MSKTSRDRPPLASHDFASGGVTEALEFLKRARFELRMLRRVQVWPDHLRVYDVNGDSLEVRGVGYESADIVTLLNAVHTAFDPQTIHEPATTPFKEFLTGRRHPWAEDRVM